LFEKEELTVRWKCPYCSKGIYTNEQYQEETEDVGNGFEWEVEHKEEYCKKTN
jgi:hypothetical protein